MYSDPSGNIFFPISHDLVSNLPHFKKEIKNN